MSLHLKIIMIQWNSYCHQDMLAALRDQGHQVTNLPFPEGIRTEKAQAERILGKALREQRCDLVFSFNYFPVISGICQEAEVRYLSWVYDSPYIHVYSYTVLNPCNFIFLFDRAVYEELRAAGIDTVHHLPLGVNEKRLAGFGIDVPESRGDVPGASSEEKKRDVTERNKGRLAEEVMDISFAGSLYTEQKHRIYDRFQEVAPYTRGYLEAIVQAQKRVYGYNFLRELLTADILEALQKAYPTDPNALTAMPPEAIYADYVFSREVTALERQEILTLLGERHQVHLFTNDGSWRAPGVCNRGTVDYYREMPAVFKNSKINLNITLRSIKTGIPLRALDIMGSGGFLLTNYQPELVEFFEPDVDFVFYNDYQDLLEKVDYYLGHERERQEIAANGFEKACREHTYQKRIGEMLRTAGFL